MTVDEKALGQKSGLRVRSHSVHVLHVPGWIASGAGTSINAGFTGLNGLRSLFTNKYLPYPRSITFRATTDATAGNRIWGFQIFGRTHRGQGATELMNPDGVSDAVPPSQTDFVRHSKTVWGDIERIFFGGFVNWAVGDTMDVGLHYTGHQANVLFGSPIDLESKDDFLNGSKTSGALTLPVGLDISTIAVDKLQKAFKLPTSPAIAANDLVTLWIRSGVNG